jgi:hypothetical protein
VSLLPAPLSDNPLNDPVALKLVELAHLLGGYRWAELRLFEVLGGWVANESSPEARLLFDTLSRSHAWHAQLWADLLPDVQGVIDPDVATVAPNNGAAEVLSSLGRGSEDGGGGTLVRLVGLSRVVSPRLISGYSNHLRRAVAVSDGPVIRVLRLVLRDETEAWQAAELMIQSLIRRPHDVAVVTAHQQRLETLVAGTGPGLVPWPEADSGLDATVRLT